MVHAKREIMFLPQKDQMIVETAEFAEMRNQLNDQVVKSSAEDEKKRPTLLSGAESCNRNSSSIRMKRIPLSGCGEGFIPLRANGPKE